LVREREREREKERKRERESAGLLNFYACTIFKSSQFREREKERDRERGKEREKERENCYFKRNGGCLGTF
jgi:hypothetical protein